MVGLDGSAASEPALGYAFAYAASTPSTLTPVHAWWWEPLEGVSLGEPWIGDWTQIASQQEAMLSESLAGWSQRYPDVHLKSYVVRGDRSSDSLGGNPVVQGREETVPPVGGRLYVASCWAITKPGTVWQLQ